MTHRTRVVGDVSGLPDYAFGLRSLIFWGVMGFMAVEGTAFLLAAGTYLYLRGPAELVVPATTSRSSTPRATSGWRRSADVRANRRPPCTTDVITACPNQESDSGESEVWPRADRADQVQAFHHHGAEMR